VIRLLRLALCLYAAILVQTVVVPNLAIAGVRPDIPFLIVLVIAFYEGGVGGAIAGFVAGLFVDLNSAGALGVTSLANSVVAFAAGTAAQHLERKSWITRVLVALAATALRDQGEILIQTRGDIGEAARLFWRSSLPGGVYTAFIAPLVMRATEWAVGLEKEAIHPYR
jgi:rod shape-determining protein MreD